MSGKFITINWRSNFALLPLFILLCIAILSRSSTYSTELIGDEGKFYEHAVYITQGQFADTENPNFKEGPGYPLYLAVSAALKLPFALTRISNILFIFLGCWLLFKILKRYINYKYATIFTYLFALYPPMLRWANLMYAESLAIFLLLGFCYHFISWFHKEGNVRKHFLFAILFMGSLALTKIIFAYVVVVALLTSLLLLSVPGYRKTFQLKKTALLFAGVLIFISPYLVYGYYITDKFFYLGMHGGRILYFRTTPFENEFGNSFNLQAVLLDDMPEMRKDVFVDIERLQNNHREFFAGMDSLSHIERDSVFKAKAIENLKRYPNKYVQNTLANISRIFFHMPFSYRIQNMETLGYLIPNIFILVLALLGIYPAIKRREMIPKELQIILLMSLIYLGGHTLLGGRGRFLIPVVPLWIIYFSFVYLRILQIRIKSKNEINDLID